MYSEYNKNISNIGTYYLYSLFKYLSRTNNKLILKKIGFLPVNNFSDKIYLLAV